MKYLRSITTAIYGCGKIVRSAFHAIDDFVAPPSYFPSFPRRPTTFFPDNELSEKVNQILKEDDTTMLESKISKP